MAGLVPAIHAAVLRSPWKATASLRCSTAWIPGT